MKNLVLIGASGVCHEIIDTIVDINKDGPAWNVIGIIDDDEKKHGERFYNDIPIIGGSEKIGNYNLSNTEFLLTFSSSASYLKREAYVSSLLRDFPAISFATIIHPKAYISPSATIGGGTYIGLGAIIDSNAVVGEHCLILFNSIISRFVEIGDYTFISASVNITGGKTIGKSVYLGVKSTVNANIESNVLVSAGSLVIKDIQQNCIVFNQSNQEVISFKTAAELQTTLKQFAKM